MGCNNGHWRDERNGFPASGDPAHRLIGRSAAMRKLYEHIEIIGCSDATVLIEGETGVGKNRVARLIHLMGPRAARPYVAFNATTLPQELFESELFGHTKGAFTGAYDHHKGLARTAEGGTLFIDEVGELSSGNQVKLLSFLDQKQVRPVGGLRSIDVDLRVIAATNRDLRARMRSGAFRHDLYYRLRVFPIHIPSLRERLEDVPLLVDYFLDKYGRKYRRQIPGISREAMNRLRTWPWEGNVRELESVIEHAVILTSEGQTIEADTLSLEDERPVAPPAVPGPAPVDRPLAEPTPLRASRSAAERSLILQALRRRRWNVSATARDLGISRVGLTRKLKRLGIHRPGTGSSAETVLDT